MPYTCLHTCQCTCLIVVAAKQETEIKALKTELAVAAKQETEIKALKTELEDTKVWIRSSLAGHDSSAMGRRHSVPTKDTEGKHRHACTCTCTCTHTRARACARTHTHTHTYVCVYTEA